VSELIAKVKKNALKGKGTLLVGRAGRRASAPFSLLCQDNYSQIRVRICEAKVKGDNLAHLIFTFTTAPAIQPVGEISSS